jgi:hypothetical protein
MIEYAKSHGENIIFNNTENEMKGGYPITKILKENLPNIEMLGGSKTKEELGLSRFEHLSIPLGLYVNKEFNTLFKGGSRKTKEKEANLLEHDHFDNLLNLVSVMRGGSERKIKTHKRNTVINKTKKNVE